MRNPPLATGMAVIGLAFAVSACVPTQSSGFGHGQTACNQFGQDQFGQACFSNPNAMSFGQPHQTGFQQQSFGYPSGGGHGGGGHGGGGYGGGGPTGPGPGPREYFQTGPSYKVVVTPGVAVSQPMMGYQQQMSYQQQRPSPCGCGGSPGPLLSY